jgi:hypothetical protein
MAQERHFDMAEEFAGIDFHSIRLEGRFVRTMETLIKQPDKSIWEASGDRAEAKAVYRMLGNEEFDRKEIIRAAPGSGHTAYVRLWRYDFGRPGYHCRKLQHPPEDRRDRVYQ